METPSVAIASAGHSARAVRLRPRRVCAAPSPAVSIELSIAVATEHAGDQCPLRWRRAEIHPVCPPAPSRNPHFAHHQGDRPDVVDRRALREIRRRRRDEAACPRETAERLRHHIAEHGIRIAVLAARPLLYGRREEQGLGEPECVIDAVAIEQPGFLLSFLSRRFIILGHIGGRVCPCLESGACIVCRCVRAVHE